MGLLAPAGCSNWHYHCSIGCRVCHSGGMAFCRLDLNRENMSYSSRHGRSGFRMSESQMKLTLVLFLVIFLVRLALIGGAEVERGEIGKYCMDLAAELAYEPGETPWLAPRSLQVLATAYNSVEDQTDDTPWLAAWQNQLRPGQRVVAVSRSLERRYNITDGTVIFIEGLDGVWRVRDRMSSKWKDDRIDIWMEEDVEKARAFGARRLRIEWVEGSRI